MQALDLHIVVVDDNAVIRRSHRDVLEAAGCRVVEAGSADEALVTIGAIAPTVDVVITDIEMPGSMDGIVLAQAISRRWPQIGLIVSSGLLTPRVDQLPAGAVFMPKPNTARTLFRHLVPFASREAAGHLGEADRDPLLVEGELCPIANIPHPITRDPQSESKVGFV
jgi:CheY-like chemotaxis protein